jgi:hypothetical protein
MKTIVTSFNVCDLLQTRLIKISPIWWDGRDHRFFILKLLKPHREFFEVLEDIPVQLSNGDVIVIEAGYRTDFSSVPRALWGVKPPYGPFLFAALIHDWLYNNIYISREFADREMYLWSQIINQDPRDNRIRYWAVRKFGKGWWDKNVRRLQFSFQ